MRCTFIGQSYEQTGRNKYRTSEGFPKSLQGFSCLFKLISPNCADFSSFFNYETRLLCIEKLGNMQRIFVIIENIRLACLLDLTADFGVQKQTRKSGAELPAAREEQNWYP